MEKEWEEGNISLSKSVLVDPSPTEQTNAILLLPEEDRAVFWLKKLKRGLKNSGKWSSPKGPQFEEIGRHARHQVEEGCNPDGSLRVEILEPAQLKHNKSALEEYIDSLYDYVQ